MLPACALERLRRGVQIAGAIIDDRNAQRDASRFWKQADDLVSGQRRRPRKGLAWNIARRAVARRDRPPVDRCSACAVWRSSDRKNRRSGRLLVIGDHDVELTASCAATKVQRSRLAASNPSNSASSCPRERSTSRQRQGEPAPTSTAIIKDDPAEQRQPQTMPGKPHHAEKRGPEMKASRTNVKRSVARKSALLVTGAMHCVNGM